MIIAKTPFRISFFGGSTDYESFYKEHGSFLIGTTIDKYSYLSMRTRPTILSKEHLVVYSKMEYVKESDAISNPLIRETLKFKNVGEWIEFFSFSDIPARTGLGGSSAYCVGLLYLINALKGNPMEAKELIRDAIHIERNILKEPGGIQDQIWPAYGGLNSVEILPHSGEIRVKPMPVTEEFYKELESSVLLIYTNEQRSQEEIAKSHDGAEKKRILEISKEAYQYFLKENIQCIGKLLYDSWKAKRSISPLISNTKVDATIETAMREGAYGAKLLGTGGCGFVMVLCNPTVKERLVKTFGDAILPAKFESDGVSQIYPAISYENRNRFGLLQSPSLRSFAVH
jgi:D-glycero-alpha-D-manno-heptose-7-phosphate kinase